MTTAAVNPLRLSRLAPGAVQSEIRAMSVECDRMGGVNLAQGICDMPLPAAVEEAAIAAIRNGRNIYTRADGISPLREALAEKLWRHNGIRADPSSEIVVTSGATGALYPSCLALFDPGDEVLVFEPFYGYHLNTLVSLGVVPIVVPLAAGSWEMDGDALASAITARTRGLILNSPGNPSGKIFSRVELELIATKALEHNLFVLTDEIYEYFIYGGAQHMSIATLPGMADRTITISGLSKTFSMTGWRIGYLTASRKWTSAISYFHDLVYVCAPAPFQYAAAAGLGALPESFYRTLSTEYQKKRDRLCAALEAAEMSPSIPAGAYYVLASSSGIEGADAKAKARTLLRTTGIAAVAGSAFYRPGYAENMLRFCFAKSEADLDRACSALAGLGS